MTAHRAMKISWSQGLSIDYRARESPTFKLFAPHYIEDILSDTNGYTIFETPEKEGQKARSQKSCSDAGRGTRCVTIVVKRTTEKLNSSRDIGNAWLFMGHSASKKIFPKLNEFGLKNKRSCAGIFASEENDSTIGE